MASICKIVFAFEHSHIYLIFIIILQNAWIPRRNGNNLKTPDQLHNEAEKEAPEDLKAYQNINYSKRIPDDRRIISGMFKF